MNSADADAPQNLYEIQWAAKTAEDRGDIYRADAMLQRIAYLEGLRAKLERDIEFGDLLSTSTLSTIDLSQLLVMVERQILHYGAAVARLIGGGCA
jgi:uncharacterized protein HemY